MIRHQKGFTLIEMLVVIAIIAVIGTMSTQIILSLIKSNNKTNIQNEVKQNGSFVLDKMERDIRGSTNATSSSATTLALTQSDGSTVTYTCVLGILGSSNGSVQRQGVGLLNTDSVTGVRVNSCSFSVSSTVPVLVTVNFTLTQAYGSPNRSDLTVSQNFATRVSLRTYN